MENEVLITSEQTPIEIALGIDEEGMTTARKLYSFLGLAQDGRKQILSTIHLR